MVKFKSVSYDKGIDDFLAKTGDHYKKLNFCVRQTIITAARSTCTELFHISKTTCFSVSTHFCLPFPFPYLVID